MEKERVLQQDLYGSEISGSRKGEKVELKSVGVEKKPRLVCVARSSSHTPVDLVLPRGCRGAAHDDNAHGARQGYNAVGT
jgi:hypothetical protein